MREKIICRERGKQKVKYKNFIYCGLNLAAVKCRTVHVSNCHYCTGQVSYDLLYWTWVGRGSVSVYCLLLQNSQHAMYACINSKYVLHTQTKTVIFDNGKMHPPVWEVLHENTTIIVTLTVQYLIMIYKKGSTPRQTGWLTASHNVTLTLTGSSVMPASYESDLVSLDVSSKKKKFEAVQKKPQVEGVISD